MAKQERSAGFVIHRRIDGADGRFLLLDYGRHWDFAKGHVEAGEDDITAARRELQEETGITDIEPVADFCQEISYYFKDRRRELVQKTVIFFLAETRSATVVLSAEHVGYAYLRFEAAMHKLSFPNAREVLRLAHERLMLRDAGAAHVQPTPNALS